MIDQKYSNIIKILNYIVKNINPRYIIAFFIFIKIVGYVSLNTIIVGIILVVLLYRSKVGICIIACFAVIAYELISVKLAIMLLIPVILFAIYNPDWTDNKKLNDNKEDCQVI